MWGVPALRAGTSARRCRGRNGCGVKLLPVQHVASSGSYSADRPNREIRMSEEKFNTKMRLALFRHSQFGWIFARDSDGTDHDDNRPRADYARISEWMDIEFKPLPIEAVVESEMLGLTKLRAQIVEEFAAKLRGVDERMANLRALTGPVQS